METRPVSIGSNVTEKNKIRSALYKTASNMKIILGRNLSIRVRNNTTINDDLS